MENDVPLLMHSWAPNAMKLFEEEFKELQNLSQMEEGTLLAELEQAKRQAAEEAERLLRPSTGGAAGGKKAPVSSKGNRHAEDAAFNAAKMAKVLEERALQLQEKNAQQTWRQLVSRYEEQQERATAAAKPVLQWEHKELEFFTSHNTDYYTMGDILAVDRPRPQEAASSSSGPVRSNSAPSSPSRASRNNSVLEQSATAPSYIIDAVQFAQAYNEALEKEYAYKVVLGSHDLPVSSTHTAEAEDNDLLHTRLKEHKPGLDLPPNDFCVSQDHGAAARTLEATKKDFFLPSLTAAAATYSGGKTAADGGVVAPLSSSLTLPSLKVKREATGKKKTAASKRGKSQPPLTTDKLSTRGATQTKKGPSTEGIECSHSALDLHSCAGQVVQVVLRFTNRRSFRTRLRVRNATHPWLKYECTYIAPAAGSTDQKDVPYETPLSSGGYIEVTVTFHPVNLTQLEFEEVLAVGVCREVNSRDGEGAEWAFLEIPVRCQTLAPSFTMRRLDDTNATAEEHTDDTQDSFQFPPILVLDKMTMRYTIENMGSTAIVNLLSDSGAFVLSVSPDTAIVLQHGEQVEVEVTFFPKDEGLWQGQLLVIVRDSETGPVLTEHQFHLEGVAVVPKVSITRIDTTTLEESETPPWRLADGEDIPRQVLEQATPGVCSSVPVLVENDTAIELPFVWRMESGLAQAEETGISAQDGVLPPHSRTEFIISLVPKDTQPLFFSWNLFLVGLPHLSNFTPEETAEVPDEILHFYECNEKLIPSASTAGDGETDEYADPFFVFQQSTRVLQAEEAEDTFAAGFFLYVLPVAPQMVIAPSCLEEAVECLIRFENTRRVTLQNRSPRPLHFYFDPTEEERPMAEGRLSYNRNEIAVYCAPRCGVVPPFSDVRVNVHFTVLQVGPCASVVDCYIPEIAESAPTLENAGNLQLEIRVTGVGPSVHTSTEYLDFGLVEMGKEVEASFTVTNDNPTPIEFDMQDPLMREPPRFVFIPPSFRLGPGDSVEVTVYRKGVSVEDEQTFFEVVVRDGATVAIETRATIQASTMVLDDAYLNFGEVPEGEWREKVFYLSNMSALDIPFTVEPGAAASPFIELEYTSGAVLQAGQRHIPFAVKARFYYNPACTEDEDAYRTLLGLRSSRGNQILLVEVRCDTVQRLRVACSLVARSDAVLEVPQDAPLLLEAPTPVASPTHGSRAVTAAPVTYKTATVKATLLDGCPIVDQRLAMEVTNQTGCNTTYHFKATQYVETYTIKESALEMIKKKKESSLPSGSKVNTYNKSPGSAVEAISQERPVFWATAKSGAESRERQRREEMAAATQLLLDGSGCATSLITAGSGPLKPHETLPLTFSLFANLPGLYEETMQLCCGALPPLSIPVRLELKGRPLLLDPTTSGLTTEHGKEVLIMPSVIAPLHTSHRKLRLLNRLPRDVAVQVTSYLGTATFMVVAVDDTVDASQVVLKLDAVPQSHLKLEEEHKGTTRVSPVKFVLPATSTMEVVVEYTPAAAMVAELLSRVDRASASESEGIEVLSANSREVTWEGSLVVTTELAVSEFNDAFFIDEFYTKYAEQYPSTRSLANSAAGQTSSNLFALPIQSIPLQPPLRTRPGRVVLKNRIIYPTESEKRKLAQAGVEGASTHRDTQHDSDHSDDDDDRDGAPTLAGVEEVRSVEELTAEATERGQLLDYLERRRTEAVEESRRYFLPVELRLRAKCGIPRLSVEPSQGKVCFPPYLIHQEHCGRTIRLTNRNRAALSFTLDIETATPAFVIACTRLLPAEVEEDPLIDEEDNDEAKQRKAAEALKWSSRESQQKAEKMLRTQVQAKEREAQLKTSTVPYQPQSVYTLRCEDAMDVTVALSDGALLQKLGELEATLVVHYPYSDEALPSSRVALSTRSAPLRSPYSLRSTTKASAAAAADTTNRLPVTQSITLYASYTVAEVHCSPEIVWFKPGQTSHDGRAQPQYALPFTLSNYSTQPVEFALVPIPLANTLVDLSSSATVGRKRDLTLRRKVKELLQLPEEMPGDAGEGVLCLQDQRDVFHLERESGVIPAATAGGQPGQTTVRVRFQEHSDVRYECAYCVYVNGDPTEEVIVLRGDSREVEA